MCVFGVRRCGTRMWEWLLHPLLHNGTEALNTSPALCYSCPPCAGVCCADVFTVMSQHSTPPLRLLGYRALSQLVPAVPAQQLAPLMHLLLPSLLQQLAASDEESLHLVLELLCVVVAGAAGPGSAGLTPEQALAVAQPVLQVG